MKKPHWDLTNDTPKGKQNVSLTPQKKSQETKPLILKGTNDLDRFTDAMNWVTELLKVNQTLRDENNDKDEQIWRKNIESYELKEESEDLRERVELLEQLIKSNTDLFQGYISKFTRPKIEMSNLE